MSMARQPRRALRAPAQPELIHDHYPSVSSMFALLAENREWKHGYNNQTLIEHKKRNGGMNWHGIVGGAAAVIDAVENGFPSGANRVAFMRDSISASLPRAVGVNRVRVRGTFGDDLDIHAINRGDFGTAWSTAKRRVKVSTSVVRIVIDICGNGEVNADTLAWRGVAGLSLAQIMQSAGYSVEIVGTMGTNRSAEGIGNLAITVLLKAHGASVDIDLLAATTCLAGFFRLFGFAAIIAACDKRDKEVNYGLGQYLDPSGILPAPINTTQLFVQQSVINEASALAWVKQGVALLQGARA
jgi:hypothetical protein